MSIRPCQYSFPSSHTYTTFTSLLTYWKGLHLTNNLDRCLPALHPILKSTTYTIQQVAIYVYREPFPQHCYWWRYTSLHHKIKVNPIRGSMNPSLSRKVGLRAIIWPDHQPAGSHPGGHPSDFDQAGRQPQRLLPWWSNRSPGRERHKRRG